MRLFKDSEEPKEMKTARFRINEVRAAQWDTKQLCVNEYHPKSKERQVNGGRSSQSQGSRPKKKHSCRWGRCWTGEDESTEKKTKAG